MTGFLNEVKSQAQIFCQVHITPPTSFFFFTIIQNLFTSSGEANALGLCISFIKWKKSLKGGGGEGFSPNYCRMFSSPSTHRPLTLLIILSPAWLYYCFHLMPTLRSHNTLTCYQQASKDQRQTPMRTTKKIRNEQGDRIQKRTNQPTQYGPTKLKGRFLFLTWVSPQNFLFFCFWDSLTW